MIEPRKVLVLPRSTRSLTAAVEQNGICRRQELPPHLDALVQQWREPRRLPQEFFAETVTKARSDPAFFSEELAAPHYIADLRPDQGNALVNAETLSALGLPKISRRILSYLQHPVSEATWAQQMYSQLIGEPLIAAGDMVNADREAEYWYMFMSDTNWTPGVFRLAAMGEPDEAGEDPFVLQAGSEGEVMLLKPDQFLAFVPPPEEAATIYHTFFLAEHKKDNDNRRDLEKLLLEGCATLVARSQYLRSFAGDQHLQWVPLVYCAAEVIEIILMWFNSETQKFEYARVRPTARAGAAFKLDQAALLVEFHKLMYGLAGAVHLQMASVTIDSFDQNKIIEFTRLSTKRSRPNESKAADANSKPQSAKKKSAQPSSSSSTSTHTKRASYPLVTACERATEQIQAHHFTPVLAANQFGFSFGPGDRGLWESLLQERPVAILKFQDPPRRTFIKIFNSEQKQRAEREATTQATLSATSLTAVPRLLHNIRVRVGRKAFVVLETEDGGDTSYLPKSFSELQLVTRQVLTSIAKIHSMGFVHCDLKPEHIAIRRSTEAEGGDDAVAAAIVDWGMAVQLPSPSGTFQVESLGTEGFSAPELQFGEECTSAVDIYSLGCTFREFAARGDALVRYQGTSPWKALFQLVYQMLATAPAARPTAQAALKHPFFALSLPQH